MSLHMKTGLFHLALTPATDTHTQSVRRSTRARKPTQTFTYQTLGQPSLQPYSAVNSLAVWGVPSISVTAVPPYHFTHPYQTLSYQTLSYPPVIPYSIPTYVY